MNNKTIFRTILILSITLNILLIGFIAGQKKFSLGPPKQPMLMMKPLMKSLPSATKKEMKKNMNMKMDEYSENNKPANNFNKNLVDFLNDEKLQISKFDTAFNSIEELMNFARITFKKQLFNTLSDMDPQERKKLAEKIEQKM